MNDAARKHAWLDVRSAVRTYSRNPTEGNARQVEVAWQEIRRVDAVSFWRAWRTAVIETSEAFATRHSDETNPR